MPRRAKNPNDQSPEPGSNYYINNDEFEDLIMEWKRTRDEKLLEIIVTDYFYVLTYNIIKTFGFKLIDWEDALQEGTITCLKKIEYFDSARGRAFNFFTTLVLNSVRGQYNGAKNFEELKAKFLSHQVDMIESTSGRKIRDFIDGNYGDFGAGDD